jgi:hypothetical protein
MISDDFFDKIMDEFIKSSKNFKNSPKKSSKLSKRSTIRMKIFQNIIKNSSKYPKN